MSRTLISQVLLGTMLIAGIAYADDDDDRRYGRSRGSDRYRNGPVYRDDGYRRGGGGYGYRDPSAIARRVISDLERVRRMSRVDSHERDHFRDARDELIKFESRWRSGRWDNGKLDDAISELRDLARADQVHPSGRRILMDDLRMLEDLRSNRHSYQAGNRFPY